MIVVKVELHSAITGKITEIARMHIWNDGTGNRLHGNYGGETFRKGSATTVQRNGRVEKYPRRLLHVWCLVARMLKNMDYK